jgi:hypothetical protein
MTATVPTAFELYFSGQQPLDERERAAREDRFFHSIQLRNGTFKSTAHHRLDDLNSFVMQWLPPQRPLEIMDVAVSSGVSSAEWLVALENAGIECHMLAGDAAVNAYLVSLGPLRALADRTGHLLQLDLAGRAIRLPPPRRRDRVRYAPLIALMRRITRLFCGRPRGAPGQPVQADRSEPVQADRSCPPFLAERCVRHRFGVTCRPVALMSPSLRDFPRLSLVEDDILLDTGYTRRFHVLRAANILNRVYFDVPTIERMLINLRSRLLPGGLLIVCRTERSGRNNGTVFTLGADGRFTATAHLNAGSEITDVVLGL